MKIRNLGMVLLLCITAFSCNDETSNIGAGIQPSEDIINIYSDKYDIASKTIFLDSMFCRTDSAYLGRYTSEKHGSIKMDFMAQVSTAKDFSWHTDILKRPDSVALKLYFKTFLGDTLAPLHVKVYELTEKLEKKKASYYTNIDVAKYCDKSKLLGERSFTIHDFKLPNSIKESANYDGPYVSIPLTKKLIKRFYDDYQKNNASFHDASTFVDFFKGVYVTVTTGDGVVILVDDIYLQFYFEYKKYDTSGALVDTLDGAATFATNKEVVLANHIEYKDIKKEYNPLDSVNYIKSPIGALTELNLPVKEVRTTLAENSVNMLRLEVNVDVQEDDLFGVPQRLLLVKKDQLKEFFENGELYDSKTSYLAAYNQKSKAYVFSNLEKLLKETEDLTSVDVVLVPVYIDVQKVSGTNKVTRIRPTFAPSIARLKKVTCNNRPLKMTLIYSEF